MRNEKIMGHLAAVVCVLIWGTTFISTKILLRGFGSVEILVIRFVIGLLALTAACPRRMILQDKKQEVYYALAGLTGVALYYLLEIVALSYTFASNVGIIISTAPFLTALVLHLCQKEETPLYRSFFVGFAAEFSGIVLISLNGASFHLSPKGDFLTLGAAFVWALYSLFLKKINTFGYSTVLNTRRIFIWGIFFMIPISLLLGFDPDWGKLTEPVYLLNFLFLGICACALCFAVWNYAVKAAGAVETSIYIYLTPIVTLAASAVILQEPITGLMMAGTILTLAGLLISEIKPKENESANEAEISERNTENEKNCPDVEV